MTTETKQSTQKRVFQNKEEFVSWLKQRTKEFAIRTIHICNSMPKSQSMQVIGYQLIKSATSTAANYRAACRARSGAEFYSKMCTVVEEADESVFWYEVIKEASLPVEQGELDWLQKEANEIVSIMVTVRKNSRMK
ncbi:MAG TPA: four helix bundle protein [Saprospiraceae bacterium]|nr:four helix bundle protein [Saprospiraceae bacterium]